MNPIQQAVEIAKQRIFEHLLNANVIPYRNEWQFQPLVSVMAEKIVDPAGEVIDDDRPTTVTANWSYPSQGGPGARPNRVARTVPVEQVLVGWGRAHNGDNSTTNTRILLAHVTANPQTTGVISIPVGANGPFAPRNRLTGEFECDPRVVLFLRAGILDKLNTPDTLLPVNQTVQGVNISNLELNISAD